MEGTGAAGEGATGMPDNQMRTELEELTMKQNEVTDEVRILFIYHKCETHRKKKNYVLSSAGC